MALVEVRDLRLRIGGNQVLDGINLDVEEGEVIALLGRSGSGKSTLLRCLGWLDKADSGRIVVDGIDFAEERRRQDLRLKVGMVFQSFNLFPHLNVESNVTLALRKTRGMSPEEARGVAHEMLHKVGMAEKAPAYPRALSGGQMQRVAIARALALQPRVLLLDEVTASLDPEMVREVQGILELLASEGVTMILVTHEIGFARRTAQRVAFLEQGRIVEAGPTNQVLDAPIAPALRAFLDVRLS
jgi:polar amino acid transport system ATP-binding protein